MFPYKMLYRTIGLFLQLSVPFLECKKVHELMTDDQILNLFHTTRDKVPEYEMVAIEHSLHKRSITRNIRINFNAFNRDVNAYLNPVDGILMSEDTPVWVAKESAGKTHYQRLKQGIMKDVLGVYQGIPDQAAVVVKSRGRRDLQFHGTIQDLTVIPLPDHLNQKLKRTDKGKRDLSKTNRTTAITRRHIVFKLNRGVSHGADAHPESTADWEPNAFILKNNENITMQIDANESVPLSKYMVFPTILVTTDFDVSVKSNDDSAYYDQIIYQMAFWNGVDLRYRRLSNPKVRLRIAGLVIGSGRSATPYLKKANNNGFINGQQALENMHMYWSKIKGGREFSSTGFHMVATVTNLNMYAALNRDKLTTVVGVAAASAICLYEKFSFYPSMIVRDNLGFGGVNAAIHELGHILGAGHDGEGVCPLLDGYIMSSTVSRTVNNARWSNCSLDSIEMTLRLRTCADKPKENSVLGKSLGRVLPGMLMTTHEQCRARGYDQACPTTPEICQVLTCYYSGFYGFITTLMTCKNSWSAAEGTECAPGSYCIDGKCLRIHDDNLNINELHVLKALMSIMLTV